MESCCVDDPSSDKTADKGKNHNPERMAARPLVPREYQLELYHQAVKENVIICSDTGKASSLKYPAYRSLLIRDRKDLNSKATYRPYDQ
jgi:hypothetical protein